jgi:hypothetical protein
MSKAELKKRDIEALPKMLGKLVDEDLTMLLSLQYGDGIMFVGLHKDLDGALSQEDVDDMLTCITDALNRAKIQ